MKKLLFLGTIPLLLAGCTERAPGSEVARTDADILVATSFYPLTFIAEQIAGEQVELFQLSAEGADPHTYEPSPTQLGRVYQADLLLYNGQGQDAWADRIREELEADGTTVMVATELVDLMNYEHEEDEHDDEHDEEHEEGHDDHMHTKWDPHVWLDPLLVSHIADELTDTLATLDPENAALYRERNAHFTASLSALDTDMRNGLASCSLDTVIVSHDAFRYLAHRYDFETLHIAGLSPSAEPSPARLAELSTLAQEKGIRHVFFETQISPALSQTLANEIDAETLVLHSIETLTAEERASNKNYFDLMRQNLANLRTALQCS